MRSLGLHGIALVLLTWWVEFRPVSERAAPAHIRLTLAPRPVPEPLAGPEVEAPAADVAESIADDSPNRSPTTPEPTAPEPDVPSPPDRDSAPPAPVDLSRLRAQIRTLALEGDEPEPEAVPGASVPTATLPWAETGSAIRGLPLGGGWMNPYVGPVQPYSETWGAPNGERRGYFVLANGQAVCTRVDAPTNDEMMNPWMSMRVTYMRLCGRVRGTAPPPDDLDHAPAPAALRVPVAGDAARGSGVP